MVGDGEGAVEGELALVDFFDVLFPGVNILVVHTLEMAEGCDAGADEVCAVPEGVAIDEAGVALGADEGVGGTDLITMRFELFEGVVDPGAFLGPGGDWGDVAGGFGFAGDG